jgi:general nucleoside transport system permease protein
MERVLVAPPAAPSSVTSRRLLPYLAQLLHWIGLLAVPFVIFALFLVAVGVDPLRTYRMMAQSALGDFYGISEVLLRAAPFVLAGLATAIPAQVRLINVGAEGQLAIGALAATFAAVALGDRFSMAVTLPVVLIAGAVGGALWAAIVGLLRMRLSVNETIASLLLNYVAALVVIYFVHGVLKDPDSFNWPYSPPFAEQARLITIGGTRLHWGVLAAPIAAIVAWYVVSRTYWGLKIRVVGGNGEAARRAGLRVERIQLLLLLVGGALAGIAGMIEVAGVEGRLRPTTGVGYGYVGFLAAWMAGQHPLAIVATSILLAILTVSGDALQISSGLPSSSVRILMAMVLIGVLAQRGFSSKSK